MKRTELKRKSPLRAKAPMKSGSTLRARRPAKKAAAKPDPRWRSRKYLDWVKTLPCVICGARADDPHHITGIGHLGGMGTKAPDQFVMPVCRPHHDEIHRDPNLWPDQWEWVARTLARAIEAGVLAPAPHHNKP